MCLNSALAMSRSNATSVDTFFDLFAGGFNVGINMDADKIVYNDINFKVRELLEYITNADIAEFYRYVVKSIQKLGLSKENKEAYMRLRDKYNGTHITRRDCRDLFLLIMYGFQQQIRFNGSLDYNNPVGQAGFNDRILEKLVSFSRISRKISLRLSLCSNTLDSMNRTPRASSRSRNASSRRSSFSFQPLNPRLPSL